jgi:hypothetical protein
MSREIEQRNVARLDPAHESVHRLLECSEFRIPDGIDRPADLGQGGGHILGVPDCVSQRRAKILIVAYDEGHPMSSSDGPESSGILGAPIGEQPSDAGS